MGLSFIYSLPYTDATLQEIHRRGILKMMFKSLFRLISIWVWVNSNAKNSNDCLDEVYFYYSIDFNDCFVNSD